MPCLSASPLLSSPVLGWAGGGSGRAPTELLLEAECGVLMGEGRGAAMRRIQQAVRTGRVDLRKVLG